MFTVLQKNKQTNKQKIKTKNKKKQQKKQQKNMWFIGVEVEQETSGPLLKKILNPPLVCSYF